MKRWKKNNPYFVNRILFGVISLAMRLTLSVCCFKVEVIDGWIVLGATGATGLEGAAKTFEADFFDTGRLTGASTGRFETTFLIYLETPHILGTNFVLKWIWQDFRPNVQPWPFNLGRIGWTKKILGYFCKGLMYFWFCCLGALVLFNPTFVL